MKAEVFTSAFSFVIFASEGPLQHTHLNLALTFNIRSNHHVRFQNPLQSNAR
jgi:hypothetical protein